MTDVIWKQTFKKDGVTYKNSAVSVYYAGTTDPVPLFDSAGTQQNTDPQCYTDSAGYVEFTLNSDDFHTGQLFDLSISPNSVCSDANVITLSSMMLLQDTEGGREYKRVFAQDAAPGSDYREGDLWFDTNYDNHPYRSNANLTWVSMRDGSISLIGYGNGIFAETWEDESRLTNYWTVTGVTPTIVTGEGLVGGKILRVGDNSGDDQCVLLFNTNIPFDRTRKYRYKVRAKQSAGSGKVYCGWAALKADGATYIDYDGTESSSLGTIADQFWHCASNWAPGSSWAESDGVTYGVASPGTIVKGTIASPGTIHSSAAYVRPLIMVNYSAAAGTVDIDAIIIEMLPPDADYVDETAAKYWAIEADADNTATNTAADTDKVGGVDSEDIAGWAYDDDTAKINGGVIADYIQSDDYVASTSGFKLDIANNKIIVADSTGLEIQSSGGMTLQKGADLILENDSASASYITYDIGTYDVHLHVSDYASSLWCIRPSADNELYCSIGVSTLYRFKEIYIRSYTKIIMSTASSSLYLDSSALYPYSGTVDLGTTSYPWNKLYLSTNGLRTYYSTHYWDVTHDSTGALLFKYDGTNAFSIGTDGKIFRWNGSSWTENT